MTSLSNLLRCFYNSHDENVFPYVCVDFLVFQFVSIDSSFPRGPLSSLPSSDEVFFIPSRQVFVD